MLTDSIQIRRHGDSGVNVLCCRGPFSDWAEHLAQAVNWFTECSAPMLISLDNVFGGDHREMAALYDLLARASTLSNVPIGIHVAGGCAGPLAALLMGARAAFVDVNADVGPCDADGEELADLRSQFVTAILTVKPQASRASLSKVFRDDALTADDVVSAGLARLSPTLDESCAMLALDAMRGSSLAWFALFEVES